MTDFKTLNLGDGDLSLATDLYQITMAAAYHGLDPMPTATFEMFVRQMPWRRNFLVFAGLEQALASLQQLRFSAEQLEYLRGLEPLADVGEDFFEALASFRFRGNVWAMPEGTVFFPNEPVMRVTGTLLEAQLVETLLLSIVNFQSTIASKAARVAIAADGRAKLAEFGSRRAHGPQAAFWVARAAYLAGFDSTSNVLAGQRLGIPVVGTMAHSFIMAFESEREAFERYLEVFPDHGILLVDTYDTLEGVRQAISLNRKFVGVRLDSGNLSELSRACRALLDEAGLPEVKIFASGDMNEDRIIALMEEGVPIDAFGIGTKLATAADSPYTPGIYKLVEIDASSGPVPKFKTSHDKFTYPGKKQVVRRTSGGIMAGDRVIRLEDAASFDRGDLLLSPVMQQGEPLEIPGLEAARARCRDQLRGLPADLRRLGAAPEAAYPVTVDPRLEALLRQELARLKAGG